MKNRLPRKKKLEERKLATETELKALIREFKGRGEDATVLEEGLVALRAYKAELKAKEAVDAGRPGGLANLGNTCYLNSTLQCMKIIPELSTSLQKFSGAGAAQGKEFVFAMRDLMTQLDRANAAQEVTPISFVNGFKIRGAAPFSHFEALIDAALGPEEGP